MVRSFKPAKKEIPHRKTPWRSGMGRLQSQWLLIVVAVLILGTISYDLLVRPGSPPQPPPALKTFNASSDVVAVTCSADGHTLAFSERDGPVTLWEWNVETRWRSLELPNLQEVKTNGLALSPNRSILAAGHDDGTVTMWNLSEATRRSVLKVGDKPIQAVVFSPDGSMLASAGAGLPDMHLGDKLAPVGRPFGGARRVRSRRWPSRTDGREIASGGWDRTVRVWDLQRGRTRVILQGHASAILAVAVSPDGSTLASTGDCAGGIRLWDVRTGQSRAVLSAPTATTTTAVAFAPDGLTLAAADDRGFVDSLGSGRTHDEERSPGPRRRGPGAGVHRTKELALFGRQ